MAGPPVTAGAVNETAAWAFPAVAVPIVGAPGTEPATVAVAADVALALPAELVAVTVHFTVLL